MRLQMGRHFTVCLVAALLICGTSAGAQNWISMGPPGGHVRALASDPRNPQRVYLGTAAGVLYRSEDGGGHWRRLAPGIPLQGCSLDELAVDRRGVVFVGYWQVDGSGGGIARSTDGGESFTLLTGVAGESVRALALAPSDPRVIAAGTLTGVFLSRDGGQRWKRITPKGHPDLLNIESLAFDPSDSRILYSGTWHLAWKTRRSGASWMPVHRGMIDDSHVMTLTVDRRHAQTLYASACTGIYRSTDGAMSWEKLQGIPFSSRRTRSFAQGGDDADLLLAGTTEGLWVSEDGGAAWRLVTSDKLIVNALLVQPDGTILLGSEGAGILRSSDRGQSWSVSNAGFSEQFVSRLLFDPEGCRLLLGIRGDPLYTGVFVSSSGGPWTRLGTGLEERQVLSLALLGETILAGTDGGVFAWAPQATGWSRLPTPVDSCEAYPRVTELLALPSNRLLAATPKGVIRSTDGGQTWARTTLWRADEAWGLAASPHDRDLVMAATQVGVFRSKDGGATWERVSSGLQDVTPHALAFMPADDRVLFATTSGGLFRSDDQGATWRQVEGGIPRSDLTGIAIHPNGRTIYTSDFTWGGIFRSVDGGLTWERMPTAGLASDRVWTLGLEPGAPERLLAAAAAGGLHLLVTSGPAPGSETPLP